MPVSRGGYPFPVTAEAGYGYTGVPPSASRIVIAIGQPSTDSFGAAPSTSERAGFGPSVPELSSVSHRHREAEGVFHGAPGVTA